MDEPAFKFVAGMLRLEHRTRVTLLLMHGYKSIVVGVLMLAFGSLPLAEAQIGLWVRPFLGGLSFAAGLLLVGALTLREHSRVRLFGEILGLTLVGLWDLCMAVGIMVSARLWAGDWHFYGLGEAIPADQPRPYATVIYLALASMVWFVHLRTVVEAVAHDQKEYAT